MGCGADFDRCDVSLGGAYAVEWVVFDGTADCSTTGAPFDCWVDVRDAATQSWHRLHTWTATTPAVSIASLDLSSNLPRTIDRIRVDAARAEGFTFHGFQNLVLHESDADADGHCLSQDCDDNDDTVGPDLPELCDGLDNDCDGLADDPSNAVFYDFDTSTAGWSLMGSAMHDPTDGLLQLTDAVNTQAAAAWHELAIYSDGFLLAFDFFIGGGSGADGMTLAFQEDGPTVLGSPGGNMGLYQSVVGASYALEFDTYYNGANDPINADHIATMNDDAQGAHVDWVNTEPPGLRNAWKRVVLRYEALTGDLTVWLDGALLMRSADPWGDIGGWLGFTAGTGGLNDQHLIDNVELCDFSLADADGDGAVDAAFGGDDCDDSDPDIGPSATDLPCDGIDNDCDGALPPDDVDDDGDGYTECDGDCDDQNATLSPGSEELCNGIDDNCDGDIPAVEADRDGDTERQCDGDCDDGNPSVFSTVNELCDDGIDNDCDGDIDGRDLTCPGSCNCNHRSGPATRTGVPAALMSLLLLGTRRRTARR
jgi:hypothetical protein